jgi:hypothetical protein
MSLKAQTYLPATTMFDRQVEQGDTRAWRG